MRIVYHVFVVVDMSYFKWRDFSCCSLHLQRQETRKFVSLILNETIFCQINGMIIIQRQDRRNHVAKSMDDLMQLSKRGEL